MEEKNEMSWEKLASEIIDGRNKVSKAKDFAIFCMALALIFITLSLSIINYKNDRDWRELFASYDYVYQDGEGYNYYNSDIGGDVNNGATD